MLWKKDKEETLIDRELKRRNEEDRLKNLKARSERARMMRERAEQRQELRSRIRSDEDVVRREKYRHVYSFGNKLQSSGKVIGSKIKSPSKGYARRVSTNMNSAAFSNFLGVGKPTKQKSNKPKKRRQKTIIIYR